VQGNICGKVKGDDIGYDILNDLRLEEQIALHNFKNLDAE